ncbi:MAG: tripartite tricarboxylate transporter substrate binding protein [Burkholderiales bacterium]|nr:tripartite tricarboxylate transporter substrate binding protein [Burkholderiales bacterium]
MNIRIRSIAGMALLLLFAGAAPAQPYPGKPIRFVIPYPPGGASDVTARLLGSKMTETWGQQVVIDNRPGANGIIALELVAKAPSDGYTILMANLGPNAINPGVYSKLPYDAEKSFATVTLTTIVPQVIVANAGIGVAGLQQMIAAAKAKPGQFKYGNGGNGSANHLAMEMLKGMAGVDIIAVPYKGDAPALADVMGGQIQFALPTVLAAITHVKAGRLKAVAVTPKKRVPSLPEVATVAESGFPDYESVSWGGVMAPAGTPKAVIDRLNAEILRILKLPDIRDKLSGLGADIVGSTPEEFAKYLRDEISKWRRVAKQANVRLD